MGWSVRIFLRGYSSALRLIPCWEDSSDDESEEVRNLTRMLQQTLAIVLVLALLAGTLTLVRKKGLAQIPFSISRTASRPKQMQVIERIPLSPQHSLHLVSVRDEVFLIGISPAGFNTISTFAIPPESVELQEVG